MIAWIDIDAAPNDEGFRVRLLDRAGGTDLAAKDGSPILSAPRVLRRLTTPSGSFPLPPEIDASAIAPQPANPRHDMYRAFCSSGAGLADFLETIAARAVDDVAPFARYLFTTLLGDAVWAAIRARAADEPLELALAFRDGADELHRLPWELMHDGSLFLAQHLRLSLTRRVPGRGVLEAIESPPRVLFVVGAKPTDISVRAGAEYLGVLRSARGQGFPLKSHLVLEATTKKIEAALDAFHPTVIHFIGHGGIDRGRGYIEVIDDKQPARPMRLTGEDLLRLLRIEPPTPAAPAVPVDPAAPAAPARPAPIVVLNACATAGNAASLDRAEQTASPLAAELIAGGVPVVMAMAGHVTDQACRLFTSRFYEALLSDGQIVRAASEGRRFGLRHTPEAHTGIDWALPAIYLPSANLELPDLAIDEEERRWQSKSSEYWPNAFPPFCGRLHLCRAYDLLLSDKTEQMQAEELKRTDLQMLAVASQTGSDAAVRVQYGRTWVLKEFASKAVRDGHLPCFIENTYRRDSSGGLDLLCDVIIEAALVARDRFELDWTWQHFTALRSMKDKDAAPASFPPRLADDYRAYGMKPQDPRVLGAALRFDLLALLGAARAKRPRARPPIKLLLLVDDVHMLGDATDALLAFLKQLRSASDDIRVVITYDDDRASQSYQSYVDSITKWIGDTSGTLSSKLSKFQEMEDKLAYNHLLLNWRDGGLPDGQAYPVTVRNSAHRDGVLAHLGKAVKGIPSSLVSASAPIISALLEFPPEASTLRRANDNEIAKAITEERS